jgi:ribonuclease VapC
VKVFDASALLAALGQEVGAEVVAAELSTRDAVVSSVNYTEVLTKLIDRGLTALQAQEAWQYLGVSVHTVDESLAFLAAGLRPASRALGLSLADRCCLALAQRLGDARVITADRAWADLPGFQITLIR